MTEQTLDRPHTHHSFQQYLAEGHLMASRCTACNALYLPPRQICPACHSSSMVWEAMKGTGTLAAVTGVHIVGSEMAARGYGRDNPNHSGVVTLEEGVQVSALLLAEDSAQLRIGVPLRIAIQTNGQGEDVQTTLAFAVAE